MILNYDLEQTDAFLFLVAMLTSMDAQIVVKLYCHC